MKMNAPVGSSIYGPLLVRIGLGLYFVLAGLIKLDDPAGFVQQVQSFNILPARFSVVYGILLPYVEIFSGGLVLLGAWTTLGSILVSLLLVSFVSAFGLFPNGAPFNKDLILLGAALSLLYSGAGALSIDKFRQSS